MVNYELLFLSLEFIGGMTTGQATLLKSAKISVTAGGLGIWWCLENQTQTDLLMNRIRHHLGWLNLVNQGKLRILTAGSLHHKELVVHMKL